MRVNSFIIQNYNSINRINFANKSISRIKNRLATGKRMDSPSDIMKLSKFTSLVRGRQVAQKNIQEGISLIQVASDGLNHMQNIGNRMKELSIQYNNGILSNKDRQLIQEEIKSLAEEFNNVATNTRFGDINVFNKSDYQIQTGPNYKDTYIIRVPKFSISSEFIKDKQEEIKPLKLNNVDINNASVRNTEINVINPTLIGEMQSENNISPNALSTIEYAQNIEDEEIITEQEVAKNEGDVLELESMSNTNPPPDINNSTSLKSNVRAFSLINNISLNRSIGSTTASKIPKYELSKPDLTIPDLGKYNGYKKVYSDNGSLLYEGTLKGGKFDGYGALYNNGNKVYEGFWNEGEMNGYGTLYNPNGNIKYQGGIRDGNANSWGTYYNDNGTISYQGDFKYGYRQGFGTSYDSNGKYQETKYYNDYKKAREENPTIPDYGDDEDITTPEIPDSPTPETPGETQENPTIPNEPNIPGEDNTNIPKTPEDLGEENPNLTPEPESPGDTQGTNPPKNEGDIGGSNGTEDKNGNEIPNGNDVPNGSEVPNGNETPNENQLPGGSIGSDISENPKEPNGPNNESNVDMPNNSNDEYNWSNPILGGNITLPFEGGAKIELDDFLKSDFIDKNILDTLSHYRSSLDIQERILELRYEHQENTEFIESEFIDKIESVDIAKEMIELAKQQMLVNTNIFLITNSLENQKQYIYELLK